jgi:limonene-1,2-epoxide hydrolase
MAANTDDPEAIIRAFCATWRERNVDKLLAWFAPDAVYHNMPLEPVRGHAEIRAVLEMFVPPASRIEFEVLAVASRGNVVFTERVDHFTVGDRKVALPVAGVFEVRDGKIAAWRDYFDMGSYQRQLG